MTSARFSIIDVTGDRKYIHDKLLGEHIPPRSGFRDVNVPHSVLSYIAALANYSSRFRCL